MEKSIVSVKNLSHRYSVQWAVKDVSFEINEKGVTGLLGSNGAGKSTTMNIICGVLNQTQGDVFINGVNLRENPVEAKKNIGFLPQQPPLYTDLTVGEYLRHAAFLRLVEPDKVDEAVDLALEKCSITHFRDRLIKNLSGGYQQRVGIAQAIVHNPQFVVLDEPTNGLDPNQIVDIRNLIRDIAKHHAVLLSTHIVSDVEYIADQILLMKDGSLVHHGTSQQLLAAAPTQVWTCTVPRAQADQLLHQYPVVNLKTLPQGVQLRVLSQTPPTPEAHPAEMSLEDLFLHYFGETAGETDAAL